MNAIDTAIIIVTHNNVGGLKALLGSIEQYTAERNVGIFIVDSGSTDENQVQYLRTLSHPLVKTVINLTTNVGPSRARNAAIHEIMTKESASIQYFLFLDDDCNILGLSWLKSLWRALAVDWRDCVVGPIMLHSKELEFNYIATSCMMVRRYVFEQGIKFDEKLGNATTAWGGEDIDFALQIKEKLKQNFKRCDLPFFHPTPKQPTVERAQLIIAADTYLRLKWHKLFYDKRVRNEASSGERWQPYPLSEEQQQVRGTRLHLGCNNIYLNDYINVDIDNPMADVAADAKDLNVYKDGTVAIILASHLLEHFTKPDAKAALREWHRVLQTGGWLILELPDAYKCCLKYMKSIENEVYNGVYETAVIGLIGRPDWSRWQAHQSLWTVKTLKQALIEAGFSEVIERKPVENTAKEYSMRLDCKK